MTTIKTAEFIRSNTDEDTLLTIKPRIYRRAMVSLYGYSIRGNDDSCIKRKNIEVNDLSEHAKNIYKQFIALESDKLGILK